jgi:hypothetical protein
MIAYGGQKHPDFQGVVCSIVFILEGRSLIVQRLLRALAQIPFQSRSSMRYIGIVLRRNSMSLMLVFVSKVLLLQCNCLYQLHASHGGSAHCLSPCSASFRYRECCQYQAIHLQVPPYHRRGPHSGPPEHDAARGPIQQSQVHRWTLHR